MALNSLGVDVPAATDVFDPDGDMRALASSLAGRIIVPVANVTERDALAASVSPTPSKPLYVHRIDAPSYARLEWTEDGSTWQSVLGITWDDAALTAATNWTITKQATAKVGPRTEMQLGITYTGPAVTVPSDGNIGNILAFSMKAIYRPISAAGLTVCDSGRLAAFGGWSAGDIYLNALAPSASLASGTSWTLQGSWLTA